MLAVAFLQTALAAFLWLPNPSLSALLTPSWEFIGIIAVLLLWSWWRHTPTRLMQIAFTVLVFLFVLLGIGQAFATREFGYDVIFALHLPYVPELFRMMYDAEPIGNFLLYVGLIAGGTMLVVVGIALAVRRVVHYAAATRGQRIGVALGVVVYVVAAAPFLGVQGRLARELVHQLDMAINLEDKLGATGRKLSVEAAWLKRSNPLQSLERPRSLLLFIAESYGHVLFHDEDFAFMPGFVEDLGTKLTAAGYAIRSGYIRSPVFGGSSWMADAALLCGVRVENQRRFESIYASSLNCLPKLFNDAGYRTIMVSANTKFLEKRHVERFPYQKFYYRENLGYAGPRFAWSFMPDQYVIQFVHEQEISKHLQTPLFATYVLTSSHHPWSKTPPYVEDWDSIGDGSLYANLKPDTFRNAFIKGKQFKPGFAHSIQYVMRSISEYLLRLPDNDWLIVIVGDHQPRQPIADKESSSWAVPMHFISRDSELIERLARYGYTPGILPKAESEPSAVGMEAFIVHLFGALVSQADE